MILCIKTKFEGEKKKTAPHVLCEPLSQSTSKQHKALSTLKTWVKNIPGRKAAFSYEILNHLTKLYWPMSRTIQIGVNYAILQPKKPTNALIFHLEIPTSLFGVKFWKRCNSGILNLQIKICLSSCCLSTPQKPHSEIHYVKRVIPKINV